MQTFPSSPAAMLNSLWQHRHLLRQILRRDIASRYRGSLLGTFWVFATPLLMLAIYTFVFGVVFQARWGDRLANTDQTTSQFALVLFSGLILHGFLAECCGRAPSIILHHSTYVTKVVFPLEILPVMVVLSNGFNLLISYGILLGGMALIGLPFHTDMLLLPVLLLPFLIATLGLSWLLASLGTYMRDIQHIIGLVMMGLLFLSPIFYPASALPEAYRPFMQLNPLTYFIEHSRNLLFSHTQPAWDTWSLTLLLSLCCAAFGYWWFQKTRKGFADIL